MPLVRPHEYVMIQVLLNGALPMAEISNVLYSKVPRCTQDEIKHTIKFMLKKSAVKEEVGKIYLNTNLDEQFREYTEDLLAYGMTQYESNYKNSEKFLLWHNYRMDQVQLKLLKDPDHNQKGTYFYGDEAIVFASLKRMLL